MHVLVIRLSAMGDVAMTVPVIVEALDQNPDLRITFLSRKPFQSFFPKSDRFQFVAVDTVNEHKGILGIHKIFKQLRAENKFDAVADLHGVLRSHILTTFFKLNGVKTATINKGRKGKNELTRKENKKLVQQEHSSARYAHVLKELNVSFQFNPDERKKYITFSAKSPLPLNNKNIGIAPFAQHEGKAYPFTKIKAIVDQLSSDKSINIYLFGGGEKESKLLTKLEGKNVFSLAGKFTMKEELALIEQLDLMVSMDSANMHLASLFGVRVISIWGATHYLAGFLGVGQKVEDVVEISAQKLECRPCSVFGAKPCFRGDYACLHQIPTEQVLAKINTAIEQKTA